MADIIKETVDKLELTDLVKTPPAAKPEAQAVTKAQVNEAVALLKDIEAANGYRGIAAAVGIPYKDVVKTHKAMQSRISALTPVEEEPIEPVEPKPVEDIVKEPVK